MGVTRGGAGFRGLSGGWDGRVVAGGASATRDGGKEAFLIEGDGGEVVS